MAQAGSLFYKLIPEIDHSALAKAATAGGTTAGKPMGLAMGKTASEEVAKGLAAGAAAAGAAAGAPMGQAMGRTASSEAAKGLAAGSPAMEQRAATLGAKVGAAIGKPLGAALSPLGPAITGAMNQFDRLPPSVQRSMAALPGHVANAGRGMVGAATSTASAMTQRFATFGEQIPTIIGTPFRAVDGIMRNFGVTGGMALGLLGGAAITTGVKFEALRENARIAFTTMLGGAQEAEKMLSDLTKFAIETPFELPGMLHATQSLIAFGFKAEEIIPTLTATGDAVAGLGGNTVMLERVTYALGQIRTRGKVMATEMLQLTNAGIPAWAILANKMGVTTSELQKMVTKGVVPAEKAIPALLKGIEEGTDGAAGKTVAFAGMMEAQSHTLTGIWARMKESFTVTMGNLVNPALPMLKAGMVKITAIFMDAPAGMKKVAEFLTPFVDRLKQAFTNLREGMAPVIDTVFKPLWEMIRNNVGPAFDWLGSTLRTVGDALVSVTGWLKQHQVVLAIMAGALGGWVATMTAAVTVLTIVRVATIAYTAVQWLLNAAWVATLGPVGLVIAALAALAAGFVYAYNHSETFRKVVNDTWEWVKNAAVTAWDAMKSVFDAFGAAIDWVVNAWGSFKQGSIDAWNAVLNAATTVWNWLKSNVFDPFMAALAAIDAAWLTFTTGASDAWNAVVAAFDTGMAAVNSAWTSFKNFATDAWNAIVEISKYAFAIITTIVLVPFQIAINLVGVVFNEFKLIAIDVWTTTKEEAQIWWEVISGIWNTVIGFLRDTFGPIWEGFKNAVVTVWNTISTAISDWWNVTVLPLWNAVITFIQTTFTNAWNGLRDFAVGVFHDIGVAISDWWNVTVLPLWNTVINFIRTTFADAWNWLRDTVAGVWNAMWTAITDWWNNKVLPIWNTVINFIKTTFADAWNWLRDTVVGVWNAVYTAIADWWNNKVLPIWNTVINFIKTTFADAWNWLRDTVAGIWNAIWTNISEWWNTHVLPLWNTIINFIKTTFTNAWNGLRDAVVASWNAIKDHISTVYTWILDHVWNPLVDFITETIPNAFRDGVKWLGEQWTKVKAALREPLQLAIDVVWNNGIVKVWNEVATLVGIPDRLQEKHLDPVATGGIMESGTLPGHTPGRDVHKFYSPSGGGLALSGGESIMRPEFTDVLGRRRINELNRAARRGGARGVRSVLATGEGLPGFADGAAGLRFARGEEGKPYVWGGVGPGGYDCSGFMAAIANVIMGRPPYHRLFSTGSFGPGKGAGGFAPGEGSQFVIGVTRNANNSGVGHMAGTLQGVNVESRGHMGVLTGSKARGAHDPLFPWRYFLPGVGAGSGPPPQQPQVHPPQLFPPERQAPPPPPAADTRSQASAKWQTVRDAVSHLPGAKNKWQEAANGVMRRIADELWKFVDAKAVAKDAELVARGGRVVPLPEIPKPGPGGIAIAPPLPLPGFGVQPQMTPELKAAQEQAAREAQWRADAIRSAPTDPNLQEIFFNAYKRRYEQDQAAWENLRRYTNDTAVQQKMFDTIKWNQDGNNLGFWRQRTTGDYPLPEQNLSGQPAGVKLMMGDLRRHFGPGVLLWSGQRPAPPPGDSSHEEGVAMDTEARDDYFDYISKNWPETGKPTMGRTYSLLRTQKGKQQINWGLRQAPGTPWVVESHKDHVHWTRDWPKYGPGHGTVDPDRIRDEGGWLPPGWNTVYNGTGQHELVLNAQQLADIARGARSGDGALIGSLTVQVPERASARDVADEVSFALRHSRRGLYPQGRRR